MVTVHGVISVRPPNHYTPEQVDAVVESKRLWIYRHGFQIAMIDEVLARLAFKTVQASESIAGALKVRPDSDVYHLQRRRSINNRFVLLEDIFLDANRFPGLQHVSLVLRDIYTVKVKYSDIQITPVAFDAIHAKQLLVSPGAPATMITRISYDMDDKIIEYDQEYWVSDVLRIELRTR